LPTGLQRALLEKEGVVFLKNDTIDLSRYLWDPTGQKGEE